MRESGKSFLAARHDDNNDDIQSRNLQNSLKIASTKLPEIKIKKTAKYKRDLNIWNTIASPVENPRHPIVFMMNCSTLSHCKNSERVLLMSTGLVILLKRRCPWCNGYRPRKWTQWHEFKSWTRLIAFYMALIPLGKVWIQFFSLQLWLNSRAD